MEGRRGLLLSLIMAACFYGNAAQLMPQSVVRASLAAPCDLPMTSQPSSSVCTQEAVADIGTENFKQILRFLYMLVNSFDIGPDHVCIRLVQYSITPRTEFLLNTDQNKKDILQYINRLPYMGGCTHTCQCFDFMLKEHFVEEAGSWAGQNVSQIAVVITDSKSQDKVESYAQNLKRKGIVVYAVGIKDADEAELKEIANAPHTQCVYSVSNLVALQGISQSIVQMLCTTVEEVKRQLMQLSPGNVGQTTTESEVI
ncbi:collagen alpha-1(XII) chain-like [Sparus aurata]|uniref:collagen alpha-1(XII) chain-like n=1 Tax=Sparus aurata TaxID=8175 RepID=UPI0011C112BF|nr:collagen alpha-1(XII) chain-like [Sparus aurata]